MIGRMHRVVIDCPDPSSLAAFYSTLLGGLPQAAPVIIVARCRHTPTRSSRTASFNSTPDDKGVEFATTSSRSMRSL